MVLGVGAEVEDVLPVATADAADGVLVHAAVAAVGGEDVLGADRIAAEEDAKPRAAVDVFWWLSAGGLDDRGQHVDERDHGAGPHVRLNGAGPDGEEGDSRAGVVEVPFAEGPLGAVVTEMDEERVVAKLLVG